MLRPSLCRSVSLLSGLLLVSLLMPCVQLLSHVAAEEAQPEVAAWGRAFDTTWARTDRPVAEQAVARTWMWGPEANTPGLLEPYAEGTDGQRVVQYFDKSRMEITTDPDIGSESPWYVTNGLLALELITGRMQVGDVAFEQSTPAAIPIAGDPQGTTGPTYATLAALLTAPALPGGTRITQRIDAAGVVSNDPSLAAQAIDAAERVTVWGIDHSVAAPFWDFMNADGLTWIDGEYRTAPLFANPFYATGYPITEAYWASVPVAGVQQDVLLQCFERRCLTYTPGNVAGWQVETGNIGQHAYAWRYATREPVLAPPAQEAPVVVLDIGHEQNTGGALGTEYAQTLRTGLATADALRAAGYTVYLTRADNATSLLSDPSLLPENAASMDAGYVEGYAHASKALQFDPDLIISLHYNGSDSPQSAGMTIYYCDFAGPQNLTLASLVRDELLAAFRSVGYEPPYAETAEDGTIGKVYGHLATLGNVYSAPFDFVGNRMGGIPMVLVEPLFMTNATELALLDDDATHAAFAAAYVRAVDAYFGR